MTVRRTVGSALERIQDVDDRVFDGLARSDTPVADAVLPRLTAAADHSKLWIALAAGLALAGGRRGRRAAGQGLASIGVASLLANQVGKRLLPRRRPTSGQVPGVRRARRVPASTSFPSGHAASAAAFAVGVSLVLPEAAVPLGVTATTVGVSRVYTGVHYPSDVLAGAALGVASAVVVDRLRRAG